MQPLHDDQQNAASFEIENDHPQSIDRVFLNPRNGYDSIALSRGCKNCVHSCSDFKIVELIFRVHNSSQQIKAQDCHSLSDPQSSQRQLTGDYDTFRQQ